MRDSPTALLAGLLTAVSLFALAGYQVTDADAGSKLLGRLAAALVELDRWVPSHREDIQLVASDRPQEAVLVDDLPVDVVISSSAALQADNGTLSGMLRAAMGRRLYEEGHEVIKDEQGGTHLPITEPARWTISLLGSDAHSFWRIAAGVTGLVLLGLVASLVAGHRSPVKPLVAGAAAAAVASFFVWIVAGAGNSLFESSVDREIMLIVRDGAWLGLRNALGVMLIALAALYLWRTLVAPRRQRAEDAHWHDFDQQDVYPGDPN